MTAADARGDSHPGPSGFAGFDPSLAELRAAAVTMAAVLTSFGCAMALQRAAHLGTGAVVQAVVLALSLARTERGGTYRDRVTGFLLLPVVAVGAAAVGGLIVRHPNAGDALFVGAIGASIWVRRFGPRATKIGTLAVLPFIALLVTPAAGPAGGAQALWTASIGLIAAFWVFTLRALAVFTGFVAAEPVAHAAGPALSTRRRAGGDAAARRLLPSTRMALQMAVGLTAAFVVGRFVFASHWPWVVLTTFIVCSGARGRGDVVHKAVLRAGGAALGTIAATIAAALVRPHQPASVVAIFAVLAGATWLRAKSYAYWAAGITAVLSLLYGYYGESASPLLLTRIAAIVAGALLGVAAAWFVVPIKTRDVARRRIADALAALSDVLAAAPHDRPALERHAAHFCAGVDELGRIARPLEAHRFVTGQRRDVPHLADAIDALRRCVAPVRAIVECALTDGGVFSAPDIARRIGAVRANVGAVRRAIGRLPGRRYEPLSTPPLGSARTPRENDATFPAQPRTRAALCAIDSALATLAAVFESPIAAPPAEASRGDAL